ncbi:hypothetical protein L5515_013483 [Caenorhabditis briggsae]|uniref:F-box domain-containing protein n=1 Tax=Caenorhabditis briggsae TaxID=6238 RepID=A0AAE9EBM7_CAEBR|nr:hypothetical protein L5515_013483 [Caenorhabditis briggsae]
MKNRDKFRFLDLPIVVTRNVLSTMNPFDILDLSRTSKRGRWYAKLKQFPSDIPVVMLEKCPHLMIEYEGNWYDFVMTDEKEKDRKRETEIDDTYGKQFEIVYVYSNNIMKDFNKLYTNAISVMNKKIRCISFWMNPLEGRIEESVKWVKLRFPTIDCITIIGQNVPQKDVQYILDNITPTLILRLMAETKEKLPLRIKGTFEQLMIENGSWITVDHATNFSFPYVAFMGTTITNQELNLILKNWIDMKCHLNTKQFEINLMDKENFLDTVLENIPYEIGQPIVPVNLYHNLVGEGCDIKRIDGLEASVYTCEGTMGLVMGLKTKN